MMTTATVDANAYAKNFWSNETDASVDLMVGHANNGTQSMETLLQYYRERVAIEEDYSRKLVNLSKKYNMATYEPKGASLADSLNVLTLETKQAGATHLSSAEKLTKTIYQPLSEYMAQQMAKTKAQNGAILDLYKYKVNAMGKVEQAEAKYEALWKKINSYKTEQILLDDTEASHVQKKIDKYSKQMIVQRETYYKLVNQYNKIQDTFKKEWCKYCQTMQLIDQERLKFTRRNIWEYANLVSASCLADDQGSENIRLSLEKCSYQKDVTTFVKLSGTGDKSTPPLKFVDFAKGAVRNDRRKQADLSSLFSSMDSADSKKRAPPQPTEQQRTMFNMIDQSGKTFEELEQQADKENRHAHNESTDIGSEPSTFKVTSDCGSHTPNTSVGSLDNHAISNPLDSSLDSSKSRRRNIEVNEVLRTSADPLQAYLDDLSLGGNGDMTKFKDSVDSKKSKHLAITPTRRLGSESSSESSRVPSRFTSRHIASRKASMKKAKSQESLHNKFITGSDLPSHSSEGFPVIKYCRAQFKYKAEIEQELSFEKKDVLMVLHQQPDGWWFAENPRTGDSGLTPSNYLVDL